MQVNVARSDFLTFSELADRWGYSAAYLHDLIRTGQIVPSVALTDQERYVGGRFSGGYFVGDVDNARHQSYAEYYVGTVFGNDDHYENRPQCDRVVFCHCPVDDPAGGYSFQFVSENADPGQAAKWFYLDHAARIGSVDGERRFRFIWSEVERFEAEHTGDDGQAKDTSSAMGMSEDSRINAQELAPEHRAVRHTTKNRIHPLDAEIERARRNALDPDDTNAVWVEILKLADSQVGCLLGVDDGEVKYDANGTVRFFKKRTLGERLRRANAR
ncbi:hypothetical protein [Paraburkholderia sp. GAS32]|uniref:hypothetical protein n=1 Tax=Paraburkholderia sp. GAS32 TaxID=3035129 RepID=UPI003D2350D7